MPRDVGIKSHQRLRLRSYSVVYAIGFINLAYHSSMLVNKFRKERRMEKAISKNMVSQQMRLYAEKIDALDLDTSDKNTKLVLSEWINIISKSTTSMLTEDEDEIQSCKDDMISSFEVIKQMAKLTDNELAKTLVDSYIEKWIMEHDLFQIHESILDYCDIADVICYSWKGTLPVAL